MRLRLRFASAEPALDEAKAGLHQHPKTTANGDAKEADGISDPVPNALQPGGQNISAEGISPRKYGTELTAQH